MLQLPAEQKETSEAVAGLKAIREAGQPSDWRSGLRQIYRTSEEEGPAGIPNALVPSLANALNELGEIKKRDGRPCGTLFRITKLTNAVGGGGASGCR